VQKNIGLIPGLYQLKTDQKSKGLVFAALQVGTLSGGLYYHLKPGSNELQRRADAAFAEYEDLGPGLPPAVYDEYFNMAVELREAAKRGSQRSEDSRRGRKIFLLSAGAVYVLNLLDVLLFDQEKILVSATQLHNTRVATVSISF
jgi:hypothetical protein